MAESPGAETGQLSLRHIIREWWRTQIDGKDDVNLKELASIGAAQLRQNPYFRERYLDETIRPLVYDVGLGVVKDLRSRRYERVVAPQGPEPRRVDITERPTTQRIQVTEVARIIEEESRWARWLEHDPISGKHILLLKMTKEQALAAAKARRDRVAPDLRIAGFLELAAGRLRPGQTIEEVWTEQSLSDLESRILVNRPKITLGPVGAKTVLEMIAGADHA